MLQQAVLTFIMKRYKTWHSHRTWVLIPTGT